MKRIVLLVALLAAAVATVGAPRAADAAATSTASFKIKNQTIGLTAVTAADDAQVVKVQFRVFLAPGECAEFGGVTTGLPKVTVDPCREQASLDKGEMHVGVKVVTVDRSQRLKVQLHVKPLTGGPYTFERFSGLGRTNTWTSAVYVKH